MKNLTELLSKFAYELKFSDLDPATVEQTKLYIADYYAACHAGYKVNAEFNKAVFETVCDISGSGSVNAILSDKTFPAEYSAFLDAVLAHGADMDDGNRKARGHVAAHVMSAVFAVAQTLDVLWEDVFVAINVGYDVYNRVAAAAQPGLVRRGFHSTGTAGAIACAAACAKLYGLDDDGIYNAMAIGALQASGLIIIAESGQACKPLNPANAAKTGIISAKLAAKGIKGPVDPLESEKGWFHAMTDNVDESMVTDGLGTVFTVNESYLKPYPSCRHTHCGIEAACVIRAKMLNDGKDPCEISAVKVYIYGDAIKIAGKIKLPEQPEDAKFSIHYSLAVALQTGNYTINDLDVPVSPVSRDIVSKTELIPDNSMEDTKAGIRGARVEVTAVDGSVYTETVLLPKGDAANPFTWEDMSAKLADCMSGISVKYTAKSVIERIRSVNTGKKFVSVLELLK